MFILNTGYDCDNLGNEEKTPEQAAGKHASFAPEETASHTGP